jgi:hypothetical protein
VYAQFQALTYYTKFRLISLNGSRVSMSLSCSKTSIRGWRDVTHVSFDMSWASITHNCLIHGGSLCHGSSEISKGYSECLWMNRTLVSRIWIAIGRLDCLPEVILGFTLTTLNLKWNSCNDFSPSHVMERWRIWKASSILLLCFIKREFTFFLELSLLLISNKSLSNTLFSRLTSYVRKVAGNHQFVFRRNILTTDKILCTLR